LQRENRECYMMAGKKFIVAYDGSPDSKKALAMAADLAHDAMAKILLVSVYSGVPLYYRMKLIVAGQQWTPKNSIKKKP